MKTLKLIAGFLMIILLAFVGVTFVEANRDEVLLTFGRLELPPTPLGFVVLTSVLFGMIVSGLLCVYEITSLHVIRRSLKKRISQYEKKESQDLDKRIIDNSPGLLAHTPVPPESLQSPLSQDKPSENT